MDQIVLSGSGMELLKRKSGFGFSGFLHFKAFSLSVGTKYPQSGEQETKESGFGWEMCCLEGSVMGVGGLSVSADLPDAAQRTFS